MTLDSGLLFWATL